MGIRLLTSLLFVLLSATAVHSQGFTCPGCALEGVSWEGVCGDGVKNGTEVCDDGGHNPSNVGDCTGCDSNCEISVLSCDPPQTDDLCNGGCNLDAGTCTGLETGTGCNADGLNCSVGVCQNGVCFDSPDPGADGQTCTGGKDGNPCTNDRCQGGECSDHPNIGNNFNCLDSEVPGCCVDATVCTQNKTCNGSGGCKYAAVPNIACPGECTLGDPQCTECKCGATNGICSKQNKLNNTACNDNNACTNLQDTCQTGVCTGGGNKCPITGCANTTTGACVCPSKLIPSGFGSLTPVASTRCPSVTGTSSQSGSGGVGPGATFSWGGLGASGGNGQRILWTVTSFADTPECRHKTASSTFSPTNQPSCALSGGNPSTSKSTVCAFQQIGSSPSTETACKTILPGAPQSIGFSPSFSGADITAGNAKIGFCVKNAEGGTHTITCSTGTQWTAQQESN